MCAAIYYSFTLFTLLLHCRPGVIVHFSIRGAEMLGFPFWNATDNLKMIASHPLALYMNATNISFPSKSGQPHALWHYIVDTKWTLTIALFPLSIFVRLSCVTLWVCVYFFHFFYILTNEVIWWLVRLLANCWSD